MKDTPDTREQLIGRIAKGADAYAILKQLDPRFEAIQDLYKSDLVAAVRQKLEDREIVLIACKIAALDDVYNNIHADTVTGDRAQREANLLEAESGKH